VAAEAAVGGAAMVAVGNVNEGTTIVAAAEVAMVAAGPMKLAQGTLTTTTLGQLPQSKEENRTKRLKLANNQVSKDIIYTYWTDYG